MLDLSNDVDARIRNVVDFVFLPGYTNPTVAVLCQSEQTWAGYALCLSLVNINLIRGFNQSSQGVP